MKRSHLGTEMWKLHKKERCSSTVLIAKTNYVRTGIYVRQSCTAVSTGKLSGGINWQFFCMIKNIFIWTNHCCCQIILSIHPNLLWEWLTIFYTISNSYSINPLCYLRKFKFLWHFLFLSVIIWTQTDLFVSLQQGFEGGNRTPSANPDLEMSTSSFLCQTRHE